MDEMRIKVSTGELLAAADDIDSLVKQARDTFGEIKNIVEASSYYWDGYGRSAYTESYRTKQEMVYTALNRFQENASDLRIISEEYERAERESKEIANELPSDVIF